MSYSQLVGLLEPGQFSQLQIVRQHLLQDPTALDHRPPTSEEEQQRGNQESPSPQA